MKMRTTLFGLHPYRTEARGARAGAKLGVFAGLLALAIAGQASAGCGAPPEANAKVPTAFRSPSATTGGQLVSAVYRPGAEDRFLLVSDDEGPGPGAGIVGMWRFQLVSNGVVVDDGYAQWHSDGTEIQNSGVHAPITSNFCLGVWQKVGFDTYELNHFPIAWSSDGQSPQLEIHLTETVHLTDSNHLTGTFAITAYPWNGSDGLNVAGPALGPPTTGTVTATRVTISSTVPGL